MQMVRRVALNGVQLDAVDSAVIITGVEPADGRENIGAADTAAGFGQRILSKRRSTLDMIVRFRILKHGRSASGMQDRAQVLEKVNAWARGGGVLTTNYKPGRRLNVILAQAPGEGSLWDFTKEFQITFRAYAVPYWEDTDTSTDTVGTEDDEASKNVTFGGSAETQVDVEVTNTSEDTMNAVTITVGGTTMAFDDLAVASGKKLIIDHVDGLVRIRKTKGVGTDDMMANRSPESANDFIAAPGAQACSYTADKACSVKLTWRNRYL